MDSKLILVLTTVLLFSLFAWLLVKRSEYKFITISISLLPITYIPLEFTNSKYVSFSYVILFLLLIMMFKYVNFRERLHLIEKLIICLGLYFAIRYSYGFLFEHYTLSDTFNILTGETSRIFSALILFRIGRSSFYRISVANGIIIALSLVIGFQFIQTIMGLDYLLSVGYENPMFSYYTGHGTMRPFSTFLNPVVYGDYLIVLLSFIFWIKPNDKYLMWIKWMLLAIGLICLILTKTRSSWVAAIISIVFVLIILPQKNWNKIIISLSIACSALVSLFLFVPSLIFPYLRRFLSIFNPSYSSNSIRLSLWKGTSSAIFDRPIFGYGQADFETVLNNYLPRELSSLGHPNQTFLEFGFRYGLIGVVILITLLVVTLIKMIRNSRIGEPYALTSLNASICFLICSLFESLWGSYSMMITIFLILGLGYSFESKHEPYVVEIFGKEVKLHGV